MSSLAGLSSPWTVDVRGLSRSCHAEALFEAFDKLRPGDAMIAVTDHAPRKLFHHLEANHKGQFEWSPLESGPATWRTEVTRREAVPGTLRSIHEALEWDHDRLDARLEAAFGAREREELARAGELFAEFALGLRRHIRFEEELLFPAFEAHTGQPPHTGPTGVMRAEHREIEALLEALAEAASLPGQAAEVLREDLVRILGWHNQKEEGVLYPQIDESVGDIEKDALIGRFQAS